MKRLILIAASLLLVPCISTSIASAQTCKPDMSKEDKITKERIDVWTHVLSATGFASSLLTSSTGKITATVGRYGTLNAINIQIEKRERSATNAVLESARRGAVGQPLRPLRHVQAPAPLGDPEDGGGPRRSLLLE